MFPSTVHRVFKNTSQSINKAIEVRTEKEIQKYLGASYEQITRRIGELQHEWDIERTLEATASSLVVLSSVMGLAKNKMWFGATGVVGAFLLQHALQGWCPPLSFFRKLGVRTSTEILTEVNALKNLRGDYADPDLTSECILKQFDLARNQKLFQ